jgi:hypothetical protein
MENEWRLRLKTFPSALNWSNSRTIRSKSNQPVFWLFYRLYCAIFHFSQGIITQSVIGGAVQIIWTAIKNSIRFAVLSGT